MFIGLLSVFTTGHFGGLLVSNSKRPTFQARLTFVDNHDECQCECKELDDWSSCKD